MGKRTRRAGCACRRRRSGWLSAQREPQSGRKGPRECRAMQKQQRAKAGMKVVKPCKLLAKSCKITQHVLGARPLGIVK